MSLAIALVAFVCGSLAAWFWWKSAAVPVLPLWAHGDHAFEPVDPTASQAGWIAGTAQAIRARIVSP
jgi:hypothetical protein